MNMNMNMKNIPIIPPPPAPPNLPIPQSPNIKPTSSLIIFANNPGVKEFDVGEWICIEALFFVDFVVDDVVVDFGHDDGSG